MKIMMRTFVERVDLPLVIDAWRATTKRAHGILKGFSKSQMKYHVETVIKPIVSRAKPLMAVEPNHPEQIFGFICGEFQGETPVLHMLYVRKMWRTYGIGTALMRATFTCLGRETIYTTHPMPALPFFREKWRLKSNPYLVINGKKAKRTSDSDQWDSFEEQGQGSTSIHRWQDMGSDNPTSCP
jgi:GNAT superfamily N-acetyltransferase